MAESKNNIPFIMLKNVRCSFPALFERPIIAGETGKCGAKFLLDPKDHEQKALIVRLRKLAQAIAEKQIKAKIKPDNYFIRNGDLENREEYKGYWVVSANCNPPSKPLVLAGDGKTPVTSEENCKIYSGCRVTAKIQPWGQKNQYGKRVNASLVAIQFFADDEPLSSTHIPTEVAMDGFSAVDDGDEFNEFEDFDTDDDDVLDFDSDNDLELDD